MTPAARTLHTGSGHRPTSGAERRAAAMNRFGTSLTHPEPQPSSTSSRSKQTAPLNPRTARTRAIPVRLLGRDISPLPEGDPGRVSATGSFPAPVLTSSSVEGLAPGIAVASDERPGVVGRVCERHNAQDERCSSQQSTFTKRSVCDEPENHSRNKAADQQTISRIPGHR